jgi:ubiquinone biosynthesis UbiH/UbiF/VisC/COQ6 family hydroxylase
MSDGPDPTGSAGLLISGAGSVGAALALAAARAGVPVTLVERREEAELRRDQRLFVLSEPSWRWLGEIGVLAHLETPACPIREICVEEPGQPSVRLEALDVDLPVLGYTVWAHGLEEALRRALRSETAIRLLYGSRIERSVPVCGEAHYRIETPQGATQITPPLAVIAEGQPPAWALGSGMRCREKDTGRAALVIPLASRVRPQSAQAYEQFEDRSLLTILPAATDRSVVIWTRPRAEARSFMEASPEKRRLDLSRQIRCRPEAMTEEGNPVLFDLISRRVTPPCADRVLLIGNAAHTVVPFAAQGLNLALRDARHLVDAIASARVRGEDWGGGAWNARFWASRVCDHRRVDQLTLGLPRLFEQTDPMVRLIRRGGWRMVARSRTLQRRILVRGLGWNP